MPNLSANGVDIEYESLGDDADPAILLVMGWGAQLILWPDELCEQLTSGGFRVIRFDNRDVGLSTHLASAGRPNLLWQTLRRMLKLKVKAPYSLNDMALDAVGLLDGLGIEAAHVVGASMGGMIGQLLAAHHPARVRSLTSIMSTTADPKLPRASRKVTGALFKRPKSTDLETLVDHGMQVWKIIGSPGYPRDETELRARVERAIKRSYDPDGGLRQMAAVMATGSFAEQSARITAPTLVIHGAADPLVPVAHGHDTAARIPGAKLEIIEGMGHDLPPPLLPRVGDLILAHARAAQSP